MGDGLCVIWCRSKSVPEKADKISSNAITHIDIVLEELVRRLVVLQDVVVATRAGERGTQQETEESACQAQGVWR